MPFLIRRALFFPDEVPSAVATRKRSPQGYLYRAVPRHYRGNVTAEPGILGSGFLQIGRHTRLSAQYFDVPARGDQFERKTRGNNFHENTVFYYDLARVSVSV